MAKTNDNSGLGGIFSGINNLLEVVQELQKQAGNAEGGTQNFTTKSGLEGVIGVNIRTNLNGEPTVSTFGNMANNGGNPSVEPVREPMVDVLEETGHYSVIAELPGAVESSIQVTLEGQTLKLEANGAAARKYAKTLELSKAVKGFPCLKSLYRHCNLYEKSFSYNCEDGPSDKSFFSPRFNLNMPV